jgi:hypothetical protein
VVALKGMDASRSENVAPPPQGVQILNAIRCAPAPHMLTNAANGL